MCQNSLALESYQKILSELHFHRKKFRKNKNGSWPDGTDILEGVYKAYCRWNMST